VIKRASFLDITSIAVLSTAITVGAQATPIKWGVLAFIAAIAMLHLLDSIRRKV
jgi:hypothetical protein